MTFTSRKVLAIGTVLALGVAASGCASHKFVRENIAVVDARVTEVDNRASAIEGRVTRVEGTANEALARANAAQKLAEGRFLYEVVLSDDSVKFNNANNSLSPEAQQRLSELAQRLKAENRNVYLEIQGHTDSSGSAAANERLGQERAEAVRRFLSTQGIPLNRMSTISYGEANPIAPNNTRAGRAQNRRVAIVVLS
ncbi:OmpA family protein [uncultured Brevundimonas sp.]|uniref:OmpA family protein n=1 Tax=uncultured Brevundimonas sp. TaxID=213418 RepID=UPI00262BF5B4|nr:OmpA family protein [uncultured Brevundimonas sp.]